MDEDQKAFLALMGDAVGTVLLSTTLPLVSISAALFPVTLRKIQARRLRGFTEVLRQLLAENQLSIRTHSGPNADDAAEFAWIVIRDAVDSDSVLKWNFLANVLVAGLDSTFVKEDKIFVFLDIQRKMNHLHLSLLRELATGIESYKNSMTIEDLFSRFRTKDSSITEFGLFRYTFFDLGNLGMLRISKDFRDTNSQGGYVSSEDGVDGIALTDIAGQFISLLMRFKTIQL